MIEGEGLDPLADGVQIGQALGAASLLTRVTESRDQNGNEYGDDAHDEQADQFNGVRHAASVGDGRCSRVGAVKAPAEASLIGAGACTYKRSG